METKARQSMPGGYLEGESFLHRLDPRSKLVAVLALIATTFAVQTPLQVSLLILAFLCIRFLSAVPVSRFRRLLGTLRYLFFFTLLVYVFFTPGYRLFGLPWLSRDGLYQGGLVCAQIALALCFSVLLSSTTRPLPLACGLERLLSPLRIFGVRVEQIGSSLALVLYFLDRFLTEVASGKGAVFGFRNLKSQLQSVATRAAGILTRALDQAEELARMLSRGEELPVSQAETSLRPMTGADWSFMLFSLLFTLAVGAVS